jgi:hypothetical protein
MLPTEIIERYRVRKGSEFKLGDIDPCDTCGLDIDKKDARFAEAGEAAIALQERLWADDRWAILVILQASAPPARTASSSM